MIKITDNEFKQLANYIKSNYGINLKDEKQTLVTGRLQNELIQNGFINFTDYFQHLSSDKTGMAVVTLINKITTNHTFFMREAEHFKYFKERVLPEFSEKLKDKDLRVWSAGCSSGEEPYTLAMIIDDYFGKEKVFWDTKILATDISSKVLDVGIQGRYSNDGLMSLPPSWRLNYFQKQDNEKSVVVNKIKSEVIFRKFNLMDQFPFKRKFHVIFCRNVMIYFDTDTKQKLIEKYYNSLEYGGYLFIGHSESLGRDTKFKYIMPAVYRKV